MYFQGSTLLVQSQFHAVSKSKLGVLEPILVTLRALPRPR